MEDTFERLAFLTQKLISFPTVTHDDVILGLCVNWIKDYALERNPNVIIQTFTSNSKVSILFSIGTKAPSLLFCGHLDVVEVHNSAMFTATMLDNARMRGRGAADMKGPIAAMLDIFLQEPVRGMGLLLTTDEESGGYNGVNYVLQCIDWLPAVVILPDGGANMHLVTDQKGFLTLKVRGESKPSAHTELGTGKPIEALKNGYKALLRAYPAPKSENDWHTSISMTQIDGRDLANGSPGYAEAIIDIRFPGEEGPSDALAKDVARRLHRYNFSVTILRQGPHFHIDKTSQVVQRFQEVAKDSLGASLPYTLEAGGSDARFFASKGIPVLVFQPVCADSHGHNEWIDLHSLTQFRTLCRDFLFHALNSDGEKS